MRQHCTFCGVLVPRETLLPFSDNDRLTREDAGMRLYACQDAAECGVRMEAAGLTSRAALATADNRYRLAEIVRRAGARG